MMRNMRVKKLRKEEKEGVRGEDETYMAPHNEGQFLGVVRSLMILIGEIFMRQKEKIFFTHDVDKW